MLKEPKKQLDLKDLMDHLKM